MNLSEAAVRVMEIYRRLEVQANQMLMWQNLRSHWPVDEYASLPEALEELVGVGYLDQRHENALFFFLTEEGAAYLGL